MTRQQVEAAVEQLDALGLIRKGKITGDWYTIHCPFHNNGQEKKPSCGILLQEQVKNGQIYPAGLLNCLACHTAYTLPDAITEILKIKMIPTSGVKWLEENVPGFKSDPSQMTPLVPNELMGTVLSKYAADNLRLKMQAKQQFVSERELASYRFFHPYMFERRLTNDVIMKYDVGFDANHIPPGRSKPLPCVTFPVRDREGHTLFFCRRSIEGKYFNYPEGVTKPVYGLYELPKDCKSVIVCESVFNCLTAVVYGYNAVALLGTSNTYQVEQLKQLGVKEYVLCMDPDEAGQKATKKLKKALSGSAFVWTIEMPPGKDLNDCSKEEFDLLYSQKA